MKLAAIFLAMCIVSALSAQQLPNRQERIAARIERHRIEPKDNNVFLTFASGLTSHNQLVATLKAEYSRQIKGNLYWGASLAARIHASSPTDYDWDGQGLSPYHNTVDQDIYKLDAMVFYRLPVIQSRLYFRVGTGIGAGYHRIRLIDDDYRRRNRVLPYFNVEAAWILRIAKGFEMKFSPTIAIAPSEFSVSPVKLGAPTDCVPWLTDPGFSLTLGWRF